MKHYHWTWVAIGLSLVAACLIAFYWPKPSAVSGTITVQAAEQSVISQPSQGLGQQPQKVYRVYYKDQLIGIVQDYASIDAVLARAYDTRYAALFPNAKISLATDVYIVDETTDVIYQNKDDEICQYLYDNDLFAVKAVEVDLGDGKVVYVRSADDFTNALRRYALNFISASTYAQLAANQKIPTLTDYGEQEVNVYMENKITSHEALASASEILTDEDAVFNYLCYGKDYTLHYYTVEQYDTIDGAAQKNGLTSEQLMSLNPQLTSVNQTLPVGSQLNVTYFNSPIKIVVEKQRYVKETVYKPDTKYITDQAVKAGDMVVDVAGSDGYKDSLYTDVYVNGVLTSYKLESSKVVVPAVQRVVRIGIGATTYDIGNLDFRLPCDNARMICAWGCYSGHKGADFINRYDAHGNIYACEDGIIIKNTYDSRGGWLYKIDHGNGFIFYYEHMRSRGFLAVGTRVVRGQIIGYIGSTGAATVNHVHIGIRINGIYVDPCTILAC